MLEIDLQVVMDGWQWTLHPHHCLRVWRPGRHELLAELPVTLLMTLIAHYLTQADLTGRLLTLSRMPILPAPRRPQPLPLVGPFTVAQRDAWRTRRAARRGRRKGTARIA